MHKINSICQTVCWKKLTAYFPIGLYVKLCLAVVTIVQFKSARKTQNLLGTIIWSSMLKWIQSVVRCVDRSYLYVFPMEFYVKLYSAVAAIMDFRSARKTQTWYRTIQGSFLHSDNSNGPLVIEENIFQISANQNALLALAAMFQFRSARKTQPL